MNIIDKHTGLYTDYYELTMAQSFFKTGKHEETACFDYFFRQNPFDGGFVVFAGIGNLLEVIADFKYGEEEIEFLSSTGLDQEFLNYLQDFRFSGEVMSVREGEICFPYEPLVRIQGNIVELQLLETAILNFLNFQSLVATKASRIRLAAGDRTLIDFGLRRSQGLGGIHASRAAIIGGFNATSNVFAAKAFNIPTTGTQAHSWIQSFDTEIEAFRKFSEIYPEKCVLLVDTYSTLKSGLPNAITVAKEMESRGQRMLGIRLDSGDLAYLSKKARKMLDDAGLQYVKIVASNELDEHLITSLLAQGAPLDIFGVGTKLVTADPAGALDGVYKLCLSNGKSRLKISDNSGKISLPGLKKVIRYVDSNNLFVGDAISLEGEGSFQKIYHPIFPDMNSQIGNLEGADLMMRVVSNGEILIDLPNPQDSGAYAIERLKSLPDEHKRFENPHTYKVGISEGLLELRSNLVSEKRAQQH